MGMEFLKEVFKSQLNYLKKSFYQMYFMQIYRIGLSWTRIRI